MDLFRNHRRASERPLDTADLLERNYAQLQKWAGTLARGHGGMAQDLVQELCLYFTLAKPDLSHVENIEAYLYTCLRNIYLSFIARSSREAEQFLSGPDFDTALLALGSRSPEGLLKRQNDLRRICAYSLWRKESSKSAGYLILLFFHGYTRQQIAEIGCVPLAAIYNKVMIARAEVKTHLEQSSKLRVASRNQPPEPELHVVPATSHALFVELRAMILAAKTSDCLPPEVLLAHYEVENLKPISCDLLAHLVSCERCLSLIDAHFQWPNASERDADEVFSSFEGNGSGDSASAQPMSYRAMMGRVERQIKQIYEHRPRTLSIAVNGKIVASHDIQGERSSLLSRVENPESAQFIEVFTDQRIRLALIPLTGQPPLGQPVYTQRVDLSDDRWLELTVRFDGLGLQNEVAYCDPALAMTIPDAETKPILSLSSSARAEGYTEQRWPQKVAQWAAEVLGGLRTIATTTRIAWACALSVGLCLAIYTYRSHQPALSAHAILVESVKTETADLAGKVEHRILRLERTADDGRAPFEATVESWEDAGNGRMGRRLYNAQRHLVAAQWRGRDGKLGAYASTAANDRALEANPLWAADVSARGFQSLAGENVSVRTESDHVELTSTVMPVGSRLMSAVLVLDRHYRVVGETLHTRSGSSLEHLRFKQISEERRSSSSVPDDVFKPTNLEMQSASNGLPSAGGSFLRNLAILPNARLVELQIAVLYQLSRIHADAGEPIDISLVPNGHIRVSGTVASRSRQSEIVTALASVPDRQLLDVQLASQHDLHVPLPPFRRWKSSAGNTYAVNQTGAPTDRLVQEHFTGKGLRGRQLGLAVAQFSRDALAHGQRAQQDAYALDRLGKTLTQVDLQSLSLEARRKWAEMAARHASGIESELEALDEQLAQIDRADNIREGADTTPIQNASAFSHAAAQLLRETQRLNDALGGAFATTQYSPGDAASLVADAARSIPLRGAREIAAFAFRLENSERPGEVNVNKPDRQGVHNK